MAKQVFTQAIQLDLIRRLQLMLLDALMSSGPWRAGDIAFQGGTCLNLVYASPRFSEDLDFVIGSDKGLKRVVGAAAARMESLLLTSLPGAVVKMAGRDANPEALNAKNPRTFNLSVAHADWARSIKIKVEFWLSNPQAVREYVHGVRSAQVLEAVAAGGPLRVSVAPVFLPVADLTEILVDKLHALVHRTYLKPRDVFDLWWLHAQQGIHGWSIPLVEKFDNHAHMYPGSTQALEDFIPLLSDAAETVQALVGKPEFSADLQRWLGAGSGLASPAAADAIAQLVADRCQACVQEVRETLEQRDQVEGGSLVSDVPRDGRS